MDNLLIARNKIDEIDKEMAKLFCERMQVVQDVLEYKKQHDLPVLDASREQEVISKNIQRLPNKNYENYYKSFIEKTMEVSRAMQSEMLCKNTIAYQGAKGAFSHMAAQNLFEHGNLKPYATFEDVFTAVISGKAQKGVLPFENSTAGDVSDVLDLCFTNEQIAVSATYDLPISQNLLCVKGAKLSDIKTVFSHTQALQQSRDFLQKLNLKTAEMPNTAFAAKYVFEQNDKSLAAIAGKTTAALYGLDILASDVNSSKHNTTRFIVIERKLANSAQNSDSAIDNSANSAQEQSENIVQNALQNCEGANVEKRFSLLFTVSHKAGSLAKVLAEIAQRGYNMDCIKSRPMPNVNWAYYFYTELLGAPCDELINALKEHCNTVRILGVYDNKKG